MAEAKEPTAFEKAVEKMQKYENYRSVLNQVREGKTLDELPEIASNAISDSMEDLVEICDYQGAANMLDDYLETRQMDPTADKTTLYRRVKGGLASARKRHNRWFKDKKNIEAIINTTPEKLLERIESKIYHIKPKKDSVASDGAAKIHKELYDMSNFEIKEGDDVIAVLKLDDYDKEGFSKDEKEEIENHAREYVAKYYDGLYKSDSKDKKLQDKAKGYKEDNKELVNELKRWHAGDGKRAVSKLKRIRERKLQEFKARLGGSSYKQLFEYMTQGKEKEIEDIYKKSVKAMKPYLISSVEGKELKKLYETSIIGQEIPADK